MNNYIIYSRKSTESDERQERSIEDQLKDIDRLVKREGYQVAEIVQESKSAKRPYNRPLFQEMMRRITKEEIKVRGVICYSLNRLSRNSVDSGALIYAMDTGLIEEIITIGKIYKNTPEDKFMMSIDFGTSKKFSDDLSIVVSRGMRSNAENGGWNHRAPIGYKNIREDGKAKVVIDSAKGPVITRLFEKYAEGNHSIKKLREWLYDRGVRGTTGKPFSTANIYNILKNQFYIGILKTKYGIFEGKHEHLVSLGVFEAVQALLNKNNTLKLKPITQDKDFFTFRGLIRCTSCKRTMSPYRKKGKYVYIGCTNKDCKQSTVREELIDKQVIEVLSKIEFTEEELEEVRTLLPGVVEERERNIKQEIDDLIEKRGATMAMVNKAKTYLLKGIFTEDEFIKERDKLEEEIEQIDETIDQCQIAGQEKAEDIINLLELAKMAPALYESASPDLKQQLVQEIFLELFLDEKKLNYRLKPEFNILLNKSLYCGRGDWT